MTNKSYTLIFGLTADPIHKGHEQVILNSFAYAKQQAISIERFMLIPSYAPNLIADKLQPKTAFEHRYMMCQMTSENIINKFNYPVYVSDIEKQLFYQNQQKSYSYKTLHAIKDRHKLFVLSADHFAGRWPKFRKWFHWQDLVKENGLLIHQRPGHGINLSFIEQLKQINPNVYVVTGLPSIEVSSTQIRTKLSMQQPISSKFIATSIRNYCVDNGLYE